MFIVFMYFDKVNEPTEAYQFYEISSPVLNELEPRHKMTEESVLDKFFSKPYENIQHELVVIGESYIEWVIQYAS